MAPREALPTNLRRHLEELADSVSFYREELIQRGVGADDDLVNALVLSWHDSKVGAWRDKEGLRRSDNRGQSGSDGRTNSPTRSVDDSVRSRTAT